MRNVTLHELLSFYKCSRYMVFDAAPKENILVRSVRAAFYIYMLQRCGSVILCKSDLRRVFSNIYHALLLKERGITRPIKIMNKSLYQASSVLDSFHEIFSLYEDSLGGDPIDAGTEYKVKCDCGLHYLSGKIDVVWRYKNSNYCLVYDLHSTAYNAIDRHLPYVAAYAANKTYKNYDSNRVLIYYAKMGKVKLFNCDDISVNNVGKIICMATECKYNNLHWFQGDPYRCPMCKHFSKCKVIQGV